MPLTADLRPQSRLSTLQPMKQSQFILPVLLLLGIAPASAKVDFAKEIAPVLAQRCLECHGPEKQKGKLRLDTRETAFEHVIVPGKPGESELLKLISLPEGHDDIMPAKGDPLSKAQIDLIRQWIEEGANP